MVGSCCVDAEAGQPEEEGDFDVSCGWKHSRIDPESARVSEKNCRARLLDPLGCGDSSVIFGSWIHVNSSKSQALIERGTAQEGELCLSLVGLSLVTRPHS